MAAINKSAQNEQELGTEKQKTEEPDAESESSSVTMLFVNEEEDAIPQQQNQAVSKDERKYTVFVIGKTGSGKSSVCNTIAGENVFPIGDGFLTVTTDDQAKRFKLQELDVTVVDTPDISNEEEEKLKKRLGKWRGMTKDSIACFLLAVPCTTRYSPDDYKIYKQIKELWKSDFCTRLIVAFTNGDKFQHKGERTEEQNQNQNKEQCENQSQDPNQNESQSKHEDHVRKPIGDQKKDLQHEIAQRLSYVWPELRMVMKDANNRFLVFSQKADLEDGLSDDTDNGGQPDKTDSYQVKQFVEYMKQLEPENLDKTDENQKPDDKTKIQKTPMSVTFKRFIDNHWEWIKIIAVSFAGISAIALALSLCYYFLDI